MRGRQVFLNPVTYMYLHLHTQYGGSYMICVYVHLATVVATEASTTGDGPLQLDVGDIGASVIEHLPAGVSAQCELYAVHVYVCMYIWYTAQKTL